jgi:hypothetical protein
MAPKKKGGVSRKVRITGPYSRPEESEPTYNEDSAVPTSTPTTNSNHLLSLSQMAAARETAHAKYVAQLQSMCPFLLVLQSSIYYLISTQ